MGGNLSKEQEMQFYAEINDPIYGQGEIYTSTKFPSCYVLRVVKESPQSSLLSLVEDNQNIYLVGLYGYSSAKNCNCAIKKLVTPCCVQYWQYLPFNIQSAIEYQRQQKTRFQEQEIWHIIKACINGGAALLSFNIFYQFSPQNLLISHEGKIRLNWMHIRQKNNHLSYFKKLYKQKEQLLNQQKRILRTESPYLSPQQLQSIRMQEFTRKIDFSKANVFSLGMLLLKCISLLQQQVYFYNRQQINYVIINKTMQSLEEFYSPTLLTVIGNMLNENPQKRQNLQSLNKKYFKKISTQYFIRLNRPKQIIQFLKQQYKNMNYPLKISLKKATNKKNNYEINQNDEQFKQKLNQKHQNNNEIKKYISSKNSYQQIKKKFWRQNIEKNH